MDNDSLIHRHAIPARGRPPRLSADRIIETALAMSDEGGDAAPSLNAVARRLGVSPMAIYTYFADRDAFWQALGDALMADFAFHPTEHDTPLERIAGWAAAMRAHLVARPQLIQLISWSGNSSASWVGRSTFVLDEVMALGIDGHMAIDTALWIWSTVMGAISTELMRRATPFAMRPTDLALLAPDARRCFDLVQSALRDPDYDQRSFRFAMERMLSALQAMAPAA